MTRRQVAAVVVGVTTVCAALVVGAGLSAMTAADALERARDGLVRAQDSDAATDDALVALRRAKGDVAEAEDALDGWHVDLVAAVPVLGRSWDVERAVTLTAGGVVDGATILAERLPGVRARTGGVDLPALSAVRADLAGPADRSERGLAQLRATSTDLAPRRVAEARTAALAALSPAVQTLQTAQDGLGVVSGLLGESGPRSLLVFLQNNAELRGAGGYAASFATGRLEGGKVTLGPLRDVLDVADPAEQARRVPAPPEYLEDFGPLSGNTTIWRSWNMSPHVPDSALVGARVAGVLLADEPDVVVLLDVPAMGALASLGEGVVRLPDGSSVSPEELTQALLINAYAEAGADGKAQIRRRAELQAAATSAVTRLLAGGVPASEAARTMAELAAERHLSVWSARPEEQQALEDLGAAGALLPTEGGDLSHVSVNNIGSNKLDVYVDRHLTVDATVHSDRADVVQRVRFDNRAPEDLVGYVAGVVQPGTAVSRVELSLPPAATVVAATIDGEPWPGWAAVGGARQRLASRHELPRGASSVLEVRYTLPLPDGAYSLQVVPQALAKDASLRLTVRPAEGERLQTVTGAQQRDGLVDEQGSLTRSRDLTVELRRAEPSRWERLKNWWNSPFRLGQG